jgi:hypothetical protein
MENDGFSLEDFLGEVQKLASSRHYDKPCLREWFENHGPDGGGFWACMNDHTGCLYNDGHNECMAGGHSNSPLDSNDE